jgi:hypothetical protein
MRRGPPTFVLGCCVGTALDEEPYEDRIRDGHDVHMMMGVTDGRLLFIISCLLMTHERTFKLLTPRSS